MEETDEPCEPNRWERAFRPRSPHPPRPGSDAESVATADIREKDDAHEPKRAASAFGSETTCLREFDPPLAETSWETEAAGLLLRGGRSATSIADPDAVARSASALHDLVLESIGRVAELPATEDVDTVDLAASLGATTDRFARIIATTLSESSAGTTPDALDVYRLVVLLGAHEILAGAIRELHGSYRGWACVRADVLRIRRAATLLRRSADALEQSGRSLFREGKELLAAARAVELARRIRDDLDARTKWKKELRDWSLSLERDAHERRNSLLVSVSLALTTFGALVGNAVSPSGGLIGAAVGAGIALVGFAVLPT